MVVDDDPNTTQANAFSSDQPVVLKHELVHIVIHRIYLGTNYRRRREYNKTEKMWDTVKSRIIVPTLYCQ